LLLLILNVYSNKQTKQSLGPFLGPFACGYLEVAVFCIKKLKLFYIKISLPTTLINSIQAFKTNFKGPGEFRIGTHQIIFSFKFKVNLIISPLKTLKIRQIDFSPLTDKFGYRCRCYIDIVQIYIWQYLFLPHGLV